jgi:hypothetical protein
MGSAFKLTIFHFGLINRYKYPYFPKNPTAIKHFFQKKIITGLVLAFFIIFLTSCKTCNCPAYSQTKTETEFNVSK